MFKDPKIQLALGSFLLFFLVWGVLSLALHVDAANPFLAFVASATVAAWNMLLVFVKPDGGIPSKTDDVTPAEPAPSPLEEQTK